MEKMNKKLLWIALLVYVPFIISMNPATAELPSNGTNTDERINRVNEAFLNAVKGNEENKVISLCQQEPELARSFECNFNVWRPAGFLPTWNLKLIHICALLNWATCLQFLIESEGWSVSNKENYVKMEPLHCAALNGAPSVIYYLLDKGADIHATNMFKDTALHFAAQKDNVYAVECLLQRGADINALNEFGETALHNAARDGSVLVTPCLIANGANIHDQTHHSAYTPLQFAAFMGQVPVIEYLLGRGIDINTRNTIDGQTALHGAALKGQVSAVSYLLRRDADVNAKCNSGSTALNRAIQESKHLVMRILLRHMTEINPDSMVHDYTLPAGMRADCRTYFQLRPQMLSEQALRGHEILAHDKLVKLALFYCDIPVLELILQVLGKDTLKDACFNPCDESAKDAIVRMAEDLKDEEMIAWLFANGLIHQLVYNSLCYYLNQ